MSRNVERVQVDYDEVFAETDDAIGILIADEEVWLPKSQVDDHDAALRLLTIPEWLAVDRGLE